MRILPSEMTQTTLTLKELNAILKLIDYHTWEGWYEMSEITCLDCGECCDLYNKLTEMKDEV